SHSDKFPGGAPLLNYLLRILRYEVSKKVQKSCLIEAPKRRQSCFLKSVKILWLPDHVLQTERRSVAFAEAIPAIVEGPLPRKYCSEAGVQMAGNSRGSLARSRLKSSTYRYQLRTRRRRGATRPRPRAWAHRRPGRRVGRRVR